MGEAYFSIECDEIDTFLRSPFRLLRSFFVHFPWKFQLLFLSLQAMRTTKEYVDLISAHAGELRSQFGIRSLRLFGSVSRGEQTENSDVDVFVETQTPNPFVLMEAKDYLANVFQRPVDIIRNHKNLNPRLRQRIERDGIVVF